MLKYTNTLAKRLADLCSFSFNILRNTIDKSFSLYCFLIFFFTILQRSLRISFIVKVSKEIVEENRIRQNEEQ